MVREGSVIAGWLLPSLLAAADFCMIVTRELLREPLLPHPTCQQGLSHNGNLGKFMLEFDARPPYHPVDR